MTLPLSETLINYRKKHHLMKIEMERQTGINTATLCKIEGGAIPSQLTVKKLVDAYGKPFEKYLKYSTCTVCGKKYLPRTKKNETCSSKCSQKHANKISTEWTKKHRDTIISTQTDAQRNGWKARIKKPKTTIAEFNQEARKQGKSYGERQKEILLEMMRR